MSLDSIRGSPALPSPHSSLVAAASSWLFVLDKPSRVTVLLGKRSTFAYSQEHVVEEEGAAAAGVSSSWGTNNLLRFPWVFLTCVLSPWTPKASLNLVIFPLDRAGI
jgi:hypothetical protein